MESILNASKTDIKRWWLHLLSGIIMIIAGIAILLNPLAGYVFISIFFSVSLLLSGLIEIIFASVNRKKIKGYGWYLTTGIIDLLIGLILIFYPVLTLLMIPFILGFWLMFRGVALIAFSFYLETLDDTSWGWLLIGGILLSIFSVFIILNPALGAATTIVLTCIGFLVTGIGNIAFSLRLKKVKNLREIIKKM